MAQMSLAAPVRLPTRRARRPRRTATVLAPALPALILLAVTTAGTVDPPLAGLPAQLHVLPATSVMTTPGSSVLAR